MSEKKPNTIHIQKVIDRISDLYRNERTEIRALNLELNHILDGILEVERTKGENITLATYNQLIIRRDKLKREFDLKTKYAEGIHDVREILLELLSDYHIEEINL